MAKIGTVLIELDANTAKLIKGVKESNKRLSSLQKTVTNTQKSLRNFALGAVGIYAVSNALKSLIGNAFNYNIEMENSEAKLRAMISASKDYVTTTGKQVSVLERQALVNKETADTMDLLKKVNSQTAMGMKELIDVYAIMKPGMDAVNVSTKGQVEVLKLVTNTASNFGLSADELLNGIDDLGRGTWKSSQSFGKMMTAVGVTQEGMKNAADKVEYLKEKLKETGEAQDTWSVATSNFGVAWDDLTGKITENTFGALKNTIKEVTKLLGQDGVQSNKTLANAFTEMAKVGVEVVGFVLKAINQLIHAMALAYKGYQQLGNTAAMAGNKAGQLWNEAAVAVGEFFGLDTTEDKKDLEEYNKALNQRVEIQKQLTKETVELINTNNDINSTIEKVVGNFVEYKASVDKVSTSTDKLKDKVKSLSKESDKAAKKAADKAKKDAEKKAKELRKAYETELEKLNDLTSSIGDNLAYSISSSLGVVASEIKAFYDDVMSIMEQASATSQAQSQAEGAKATGPAVAKAGSQAGIYGAIAMAALLATFNMVSSGSLSSFFGGNSNVVPPELEDINAKTSESMANSLEFIKDAQYPMLTLTRDMRNYLSIIANSFGAIENSLLRSDIDFAGNTYREYTKSGAAGFSSKDYSLYGTTLDFDAASVADLIAEDINVVRNTIIKKVYDSAWKTKTTYFDNYENVSNLFAEDIANATKAIFSGFEAISEVIGINIDGMMNEIIDIGKIDTTGKTSAEIAAEIEARFSAQTDAIAEKYLSVVAEFQKAGEGLAETAFRVAVTFDQVSHAMGLIDKAVDWRTANILADYAGGIDVLNANLKSYTENFFTDAEQYEMMVETMKKNFASLGLAMPETNADFRKLVDGIDTTTDSGAMLFAEVISLADGFAEMTDRAKSLADEQANLAEEQSRLAEQLAEEQANAIKNMIKNVSDAWLGNLSYLTLSQKAEYASGYLKIASASNGAIDSVEAARLAAVTALKSATTKEEYIPVFEKYIKTLETQEIDASNTDLLEELRNLRAEVVELREITKEAAIINNTIQA